MRRASAAALTRIAQGNDFVGIAVATDVSEPADAWWAPVETVSNSESGFERVYQGAGLLLSWPLSLAPGAAADRDRRRHAVATDRDRAVPRTIRREPRPARRPRPLLPAVAGRSVQRRDPGRRLGGPAHDWTERVSAESYRPNAERGNLAHMSWDLGPTLASWMEHHDPIAYRGFLRRRPGRQRARPVVPSHDPAAGLGGRSPDRDRLGPPRFRVAVRPAGARPVAARDRRSTWRPSGCSPTQGSATRSSRRGRPPNNTSTPGGRTASTWATAAAWRWPSTTATCRARSRSSHGRPPTPTASHRTWSSRGWRPDRSPTTSRRWSSSPPTASCTATTRRSASCSSSGSSSLGPDGDPREYDVVSLAEALAGPGGEPHRAIGIEDRTSWSCHHGVLRWTAECPCVPDGRWKGPLRAALERLAAGIDAVTEDVAAELAGHARPVGGARCLRRCRRSGRKSRPPSPPGGWAAPATPRRARGSSS